MSPVSGETGCISSGRPGQHSTEGVRFPHNARPRFISREGDITPATLKIVSLSWAEMIPGRYWRFIKSSAGGISLLGQIAHKLIWVTVKIARWTWALCHACPLELSVSTPNFVRSIGGLWNWLAVRSAIIAVVYNVNCSSERFLIYDTEKTADPTIILVWMRTDIIFGLTRTRSGWWNQKKFDWNKFVLHLIFSISNSLRADRGTRKG